MCLESDDNIWVRVHFFEKLFVHEMTFDLYLQSDDSPWSLSNLLL